MPEQLATLTIDNQTYQATPGSNLLQTCLSLGFDIPYFCWHPALGSVGACRQCAVKMFKDDKDTRGRITMACMTPVTDGMRFMSTYTLCVPNEASRLRANSVDFFRLRMPAK